MVNTISAASPSQISQSVMKQMESILEAPLLSEEPTEKLKKIMSVISSCDNSTYPEVVFHTAVVLSLSQQPITQLFRSICFELSAVKSILNVMKEKPEVAKKFSQDHLEKDIAFLAESLGRNRDDATITVHLFLSYLLVEVTAAPEHPIYPTPA